MAGKKTKTDLETVRSELRALSEAVWALRDQMTFHNAATSVTNSIAKPAATQAPDPSNSIAVTGSLNDPAAGLAVSWSFEGSPEAALAADPGRTVHVLAGLGHRQRLAILTHLLDTPATVSDLVATLDLGTTGAAYHHLNVLQAAGLVAQAARGVFSVPPAERGLILTVLAAIQAAGEATITSAPASAD